MLDALSLATLLAKGPKKYITDAKVLPLKSQLIDSLSIGNNCSNNTQREDFDPLVDIIRDKDRLRNFAETCVAKPGIMTTSVSAVLNPDFNLYRLCLIGGEQCQHI
jgi:hypothetical protein